MRSSTLLIVFCLCACAFGQSFDKPYLTAKQEGAFLLINSAVQKEVKATPAQVNKWFALFSKQMQSEQAILAKVDPNAEDLDPASKKALETLDKATAEEALSGATAAQIIRAREIALQQLKVDAFLKSDVQRDLDMTPAQRAKVASLVDAFDKATDDISADLANKADAIPQPPAGDAAAQKKYQQQINDLMLGPNSASNQIPKLQAQTQAKILALLTPLQKQKWNQMLGKPFNPSGKIPKAH